MSVSRSNLSSFRIVFLPMNLVGKWNELNKNQVQTLGESLESEHCSEPDTPV